MKRLNNLYYNICKTKNIRYIYDNVVSKNTKNKSKVLSFDNYYIENIMYIRYLLVNKYYIPGRYNIFLISEAKIRVIMSQNLLDKTINHLVSYFILKPALDRVLIDQNVATRENKGTRYAIKLFKKYINEIKLNNNRYYILKFDISKYFYNIDHDVLKRLLMKKIKDKDSLDIIFKIIDSTNYEYINMTLDKLIKRKLNRINDSDIILQLKSIPKYNNKKGLPIGNMTSQILAIFYLNDLDHYIKEKLRIKYYIRYMDDGILLHEDKKYLMKCLMDIKKLLMDKYKLELNKKTKIYCSRECVEFLGFRFFLKDKRLIVKIRNSTKTRFKKKIRKLRYKNYEKYKAVLASYNGHLRFGNCSSLIFENVKNIIKIPFY